MLALDLLAAEGWRPQKVYLHAVPQTLVRTIVEVARVTRIVLPPDLAEMPGTPDEDITTAVDVLDVLDRKLAACVAHRSQMHSGLPLALIAAELFEPAFGIERFVLARGELGEPPPERSLFAGVL